MDKFVLKKPRLDLAVTDVGCGAGIATHEPETEVTERGDTSKPVSWAFSLPYFTLSVKMVVYCIYAVLPPWRPQAQDQNANGRRIGPLSSR